jgi:hypothetical protein
MSLLRLLATGKSLVGMPNTNSRYRMRARTVLPKFGSAKNPFAPPPPNLESPGANVNASPAKLKTASLFEPAPQEPVSQEPVKPAAIKESKTPPRPVATPALPAKVEAKQAASPAPMAPSSKPGRLAGWVKKLNPLSLLPPRRGEGGRGRPARKHVQTELTLEKVRVVRNDLSDNDFNIVPGRLMGLPSGASPILSHAGSSNAEPGTWGRLTSKFLGAQHAEIR